MKTLNALLLSLAIVIAAFLLGDGMRELRTGDRYITVKGVAEREVQADLALWPLRFIATGETLAQAQQQALAAREAISAFLALQALDTKNLELQRLDVTDNRANAYQNQTGSPRFVINQTLMVRSQDIEKVRNAAQAVSTLVDAGVVLSADYGSSGPTYLFTQLNTIKPEMIAEATASARESANQFAKDAAAKLGGLRQANQGVFQILARDQAPGIQEEQQPMKVVRVVTTVQYFLK